MSQEVVETVTIRNRLGLHARPAMTFVDLAATFESEITVKRLGEENPEVVDGKSIMQMMMLAATQGSELEIRVVGPDAEDAAARLRELVDSGFDEE